MRFPITPCGSPCEPAHISCLQRFLLFWSAVFVSSFSGLHQSSTPITMSQVLNEMSGTHNQAVGNDLVK